jgi:hypothetical protein
LNEAAVAGHSSGSEAAGAWRDASPAGSVTPIVVKSRSRNGRRLQTEVGEHPHGT